jgi:sugar lactone lactonase YvrE
VLDGLTIVNGPAFSADGATMYVNDTPAGKIYRCRIAVESGEISEQTLFAELPAGHGAPDGITVDDSGCVWVALWDGAAVRRYKPDGSFVDLRVPAPRPTSACLSGSGRLFVTTARVGLADAGPESGALLAAAVDASAAPAAAFGAVAPA